jgi:NAD(P)-dependent dehydrogenase (short-subunit alcohol dehydrogenase family)
MSKLHQHHVVIVGGTSGIGLATAVLARDAGATVWAVGRSAERVAAAAAANPGIQFETLDTHDRAGLTALFSKIGTIDHVVAAATGANRTMAPFLDQTQEQFREAFDKFWGYCNVIRESAPFLATDASITLVSGSPARKCNPGMSSISCVGSAVEALTPGFSGGDGAKKNQCRRSRTDQHRHVRSTRRSTRLGVSPNDAELAY